MGFVAVPVLTDWSNASNVWTDIQAALGLANTDGYPRDFYLDISLWEGEGDPDDYAVIHVAGGSASFSGDAQFDSAPSSGTAYILGIDVTAYYDNN